VLDGPGVCFLSADCQQSVNIRPHGRQELTLSRVQSRNGCDQQFFELIKGIVTFLFNELMFLGVFSSLDFSS